MTKSLLQRNVQMSEINNALSNAEICNKEMHSASTQTSAKRLGDSSVGRPDSSLGKTIANEMQFVNEDSINDFESEESIAEWEPSSFGVPNWFCNVLRSCILFVSAIAVFFIITQTASFLADVRHLTQPEIFVLAIPLVCFGLIIAWIIIKLLILFFRLRVSPQIKVKALQELEERKRLRRCSLKKNKEAIEQLSSFLKESFSIDEKKLCLFGLSEEDINRLRKNRDLLLLESNNLSGTTLDWIVAFKQKIQDPLDCVARKRVKRYSLNAAIMAGISPFSLIDRLIVFSACISMLKELLEIYSLKPSWDKNLILMGQVIINTYLAGIIEDVTDAGIDGLSGLAEDVADKIPDYALRGTGKAAETAIQGYMVYRLGKAAIKALHPVSVPEDESIVSTLMNKIASS